MTRQLVGRKPPDIEGLRAFALSTDREDAPFYVGRTETIADIEHACVDAMRRYREGKSTPAAGSTRLIQGAPGVGKSATLRHLEERWLAGGDAPLAVTATAGYLASEEELAGRIVGSIAPGGSSALRETRTLTWRGGLKVWLATAFGGKAVATAPPTARELLGRFQWERPVCLMIDEVQNLRRDHFEVLLGYHLGEAAPAPIVPVLAGLGNSSEVLKRNGLSRTSLGSTHTLGVLAADEAAEAVRMMLEHFYVDQAGAPDDWPETLAELSDGWPMHLHNGMRALAAALVETGGRLADVDRGGVLGCAGGYRAEAYDERLNDELRGSSFLLAEAMRRIPEEGAEYGMVVNTIMEAARPQDSDIRWRLPPGMDARDYFDLLVHRGALQIGRFRGSSLYSCPIPSFREFLIRLGGQAGNAASGP